MKDGFSEGFLIGFQAGLSVSASARKKTSEEVEKIKILQEGKRLAKEWAIKKYGLKK